MSKVNLAQCCLIYTFVFTPAVGLGGESDGLSRDRCMQSQCSARERGDIRLHVNVRERRGESNVYACVTSLLACS